jgi:hypothetical protein
MGRADGTLDSDGVGGNGLKPIVTKLIGPKALKKRLLHVIPVFSRIAQDDKKD